MAPADAFVQQFRRALTKPMIPVLCFFAGVTWDSLTLTRIDRLSDNLIILLYLAALGTGIVMTYRAGSLPTAAPDDGLTLVRWVPLDRVRAYLPWAIQFLFGSLFSAYAIFYSQSASWSGTGLFFGLLVALLIANEFLRDRLSNGPLLIALYTVVVFSFLTFALPVLTGVMNVWMFLLGAALTLLIVMGLVRFTLRGIPSATPAPGVAWWTRQEIRLGLPGVLAVATLIAFYALNWIPPVPLSMKFGGIYHAVTREADVFHLSFEHAAWYHLWKRSDDRFHGDGPAFCFTAVFAPVDLKTTIYHHWYHRPSGGARLSTTDRIGLAISGGREGGYRGYSIKSKLAPGDWRVDVETDDGRVLGHIDFSVEPAAGSAPPALDTITY
jgi:hypothetical protein